MIIPVTAYPSTNSLQKSSRQAGRRDTRPLTSVDRSRGPGHLVINGTGVRFDPAVFLSCSIPLYGTALYDAAASWLRWRYPLARLILPADRWSSHAHWRDTYKAVLAGVTHHALMVDQDGFVGAGSYAEYLYFYLKRQRPSDARARSPPRMTN